MPAMSNNYNNRKIASIKNKKIYLLDTSLYIRSEEIFEVTGLSLINILHASNKVAFFSTNTVFTELSRGKRQISPKFIYDHILNSEISMNPKWRENRFIIEKNGKIGYIVLNKISATDYGQILLCQNHPELALVANDHKLLKSAKIILKKRVIGPPTLIKQLLQFHPQNKKLHKINKVVKKLYKIKKVSKIYNY